MKKIAVLIISVFVFATGAISQTVINCDQDTGYYKFNRFPSPSEVQCNCQPVYILNQNQFLRLAGRIRRLEEMNREYQTALTQLQSVNEDFKTINQKHSIYLSKLDQSIQYQDSLWNKQSALLSQSTALTDKALDKAKKFRNWSIGLAILNVVLLGVLLAK